MKYPFKKIAVILPTLLTLMFSNLGVSPVSAATVITTLDSATEVRRDTSLALNSSGFPVISYHDETNRDLKVAVCGDATCTANNTITTVDDVGAVGTFASLALNSSDFPVISYRDVTNGVLKVAVCGNTTCTANNTLTIVDATGDVGTYTSLELNSSGFPVISYHDETNTALKVAVCGNATCTANNTLTTVEDYPLSNVGLDTSLELNSSGFPVISYQDRNITADLKVAVCGDATCTANNTITTVDTGGASFDTSLALNSNGFPVISYYDTTNRDLKVAVCGDATCTANNTITAVDTTGFVGSDTSLALNSNGFPIISYHASTNRDLKLAVCGNATCTANNTLTIVDSPGNVGLSTSLALNSSGFLAISYLDFTDRDLKVAVITPPILASFTRQNPSISTTGADTVVFRAIFSEAVQNVDVSDFVVNSTSTATVSNVTMISSDVYDITVSGGNLASFNGVVGINLASGQNIQSLLGFSLSAGEPAIDETYLLTNASPRGVPSGLPETGFPQNKAITLPLQPENKAYASYSDLWLEIPKLKVKMDIVGVPVTEKEWDVTWLGNDAGWLNGSAFPTWSGNSVLTGHVWDAYNKPGPFAQLKNLKYGDKLLVHAFGQVYTYEIQESKLVSQASVSTVFKHEKNSWITLVTCEAYQEFSQQYSYRRIVRAVLVRVE
jgi:LPXTG-site transpeptidase (sortase) family protein